MELDSAVPLLMLMYRTRMGIRESNLKRNDRSKQRMKSTNDANHPDAHTRRSPVRPKPNRSHIQANALLIQDRKIGIP